MLLCSSKTLNPIPLSQPIWPLFSQPHKSPLHIFPPLTSIPKRSITLTPHCCAFSTSHSPIVPAFQPPNPSTGRRAPPPPSAGRSKKTSGGRIEGAAELRREAKQNARRRSQKLAESFFYRLKSPHKDMADNFTEEELQMMGLGYDRMVRFMEKDDPNLKHPYDWYKYGEFGPYSWRGVVVGDPVRGRFTDERVSMYGEVRDHDEFDEIEKHEMAVEFGKRMNSMNKEAGFRYFWVFVRHPRWKVSDLPWEQWTLVAEIVLEAGNQRLDKWSLMGRLGNLTRSQLTNCAAWMRPDIIYVKRPVYQCRFEPQDEFFRAILPFLDPDTENEFMFELENDDGRVELCTYFGGLCKIARVSPKAFVDDVVKAFEKLSDEKKSKCLGFLLMNHPVELLHPYTKEWKAKLEEMELGCDAPDDDEEEYGFKTSGSGGKEFTDWIEDNGDNYDEDDTVIDVKGEVDDELSTGEEEDLDPEEDEGYWENEFKKSLNSNRAMEDFVRKSMERTNKYYEKQTKTMEEEEETSANVAARNNNIPNFGDETALRGKRAKVKPEEWKQLGYGPWRKKIKKSRIPPELFLRAAVRPFTYTNLVKEIVLTRHAIIDGDIGHVKETQDKFCDSDMTVVRLGLNPRLIDPLEQKHNTKKIAFLTLLHLLISLSLLPHPYSSHCRRHLIPSDHRTATATATATPPTVYFEVTKPINRPKTNPCSYRLLHHNFVYTYHKSPVFANYTPPTDCSVKESSTVVLECKPSE
ncbi:hypothetical protein V2J09_009124 [Rumex salicifolius]